jgi:DNA-binding IclR family transcriptional regulator
MTPAPQPRTYANWETMHRALDALNNNQVDPRITPAAVATMVVIARRINPTTGIAIASYETLIEEARVSRANAPRILNTLVELGLLERTSGGLPNRANRYRLGPNVPEFLAEKSASTKQSHTSPPAAKNRMGVKFDIK